MDASSYLEYALVHWKSLKAFWPYVKTAISTEDVKLISAIKNITTEAGLGTYRMVTS